MMLREPGREPRAAGTACPPAARLSAPRSAVKGRPAFDTPAGQSGDGLMRNSFSPERPPIPIWDRPCGVVRT